MNDDTCFSIYASEINVGADRTGLNDQDYHAFLMLVNETPDNTPHIVEELHFVMNINGLAEGQDPYMHAITKLIGRDMDTLTSKGYVGGKADTMIPLWNKAIEISSAISNLELKFSTDAGREAINCRAGVKAVIDSLKLEFDPVIRGEKVESGINTNIKSLLPDHITEYQPAF